MMNKTEFINTVMPFKNRIYRFAKRMLNSDQEAEDATQEVLLKLWVGKSKISGYRSTEAFALTMTRNYCLDRLKSKQASNLRLVHNNYSENAPNALEQLELKDSVAWVERIMQELPEQQKMILHLRDIETYEMEEIAAVMKMNPTAVRVALSRARKSVREKLSQKHNYGIG
jgi:RNA polymerase sigma-70 factor (ECF subfamily)